MSNSIESLGDRMKYYEQSVMGILLPMLPIMVRIDGKNFSKWTRHLDKPFDYSFVDLMKETTKFLVEETNACIGYTQSDEISLMYYSDNIKSQTFMNGKLQKMISILASLTTAKYNELAPQILGKKYKKLAFFDCRVWTVPTKDEAANVFLWRESDAIRNSIFTLGRSIFSHNQLMLKSTSQIKETLYQNGIDWAQYSTSVKRGVWIQKRKKLRAFTPEEIENLSPKHDAHQNPQLEYYRTSFEELEMPRFSTVKNRVAVIFDGEDPCCGEK